MRSATLVAVVAMVTVGATLVAAEDLRIAAPAAVRAPHGLNDPAFIDGFSAAVDTPTSTGRAGLSAWTLSNTLWTYSTAEREVTGWLAVGFSKTWGGPPSRKTSDARRAQLREESGAQATR